MENRSKDNRVLIVFATGIVIVTAIIVVVFYFLYQVSRDSLISTWSNNVMQMSLEIENYLDKPRDAVVFTAKHVEEMMDDGCPNEEIGYFLVDETSVYASLIESNTAGIYGYCRGEYLDGSGWTPPHGYEAEERPWYKNAVAAEGKIAFTKPYQNAQTGTKTLSVSKLLDDGRSVISMDIHLDGIQKIEEAIASSRLVDAAMVVDNSGSIVAHSKKFETGKNYLTDGSEYQKELISNVFEQKNGVTYADSRSGRELVFCQQINDEWYSVLLLRESEVLGTIQYIYLISAVALFAVFIIFFVIFSVYMRKNREAGTLASEINAIADIYSTMDIMDLKDHTIRSVRASLDTGGVFSNSNNNMNATKEEVAKVLAAESSRNMLEQFMDISTLNERIGDLNSISHEYVDTQGKWNRMQFIVVERDEDGNLSKVIWAIQSIDADKKRQEMFKNLSETDALTHVLNRSGGEGRIFELLEKGKKGLLLVFDADHFKQVNDTYGHEKGDEVIIAFADSLTETFRDSDVIYRMGGDEFVVFAPSVESEEIGKLVVGRLFERLGRCSIEGLTDWKLRVSVGAVFYNEPNNVSFSEMLQKADRAMYKSKEFDGNHLTFAK